MRREYTTSEIVALSVDERNALPEGGLWITFDNGETIACPTFKTTYCAFYWSLIVRYGGDVLPSHSLMVKDPTSKHGYTAAMFKSGTHQSMMERCSWYVFSLTDRTQETFWELSREMYEVTNGIYNDSVLNGLKYMSVMDLSDMMEVILHPKIQEYKQQCLRGELSIEKTHNLCYEVVRTDTAYFGTNDIHLSVRAGLLSVIQIKQMIGPRGDIPDINSVSFPNPIDSGYIERLNYGYDSAIESRTASIALYMQGGPLETSEYNNRMCQLLCAVLGKVLYGKDADCGTPHTLAWRVKSMHQLRCLRGKNMVTDDGIVMIDGTETHLIGKFIKLRSIVTCMAPVQGTACLTCLGKNGHIVPPNASFGHILSIDPLSQITQTLLSAKHVISNVVALFLLLTGTRSKFLSYAEDKFRLKMVEQKEPTRLRIRSEDASFISDIFITDDMDGINVGALSDIHEMLFTTYDADELPVRHEAVDVSVAGTGAALSVEMLKYLKVNKWELVDNDYLEIDMVDWDYSLPMLYTKRVSQDITATLKSFKAFIAPKKDKRKRDGKGIDTCDSVEEALQELYEVMSVKLDVNFTHLEIFVKPLMASMNDYSMPRPGQPYRFIHMHEAILNRSAAGALAFQYQHHYIMDPKNYLIDPKTLPVHPLDGLFTTGKY